MESRPKEALLDYVVRYVEAHLNARAHWEAPHSRCAGRMARWTGDPKSHRAAQKSARFLWPHDPHNPYELQTHRSPPEMYVSLLTLPVGPDGLQVSFHIP
ncbi:MAG TPA: hypothetical protein VFB21_19605 [Chthonomonadaceae bacterium]|nr:hypothetical protein [Chthonomonadaceae bacterium]